MSRTKANILVGQSGGPTCAINASLAGIIEAALNQPETGIIYGGIHGIQGILEENLINLTQLCQEDHNFISKLKVSPSMYLGSCRFKLPPSWAEDQTYGNIFEIFKKYNIKHFFYIGGNDSMDTVSQLSNYAKNHNCDVTIMGIPKTIDNDLTDIDHTPGFGSAAKYIATSFLEMAHDTSIYNMSSVLIVEVMGRNAGWLTASSALARSSQNTAPHLVYLPEVPFSTSGFIQDVKHQLMKQSQVVIAVSEGIKDNQGNYISAQASRVDQFGHIMLNGTGKYLESLINDTIGCKVRSVELNVLQRCASHLASLTDIEEAYKLGQFGVLAAMAGESGRMVSLERISNHPYTTKCCTVPIENVANLEKKIPASWIHPSGHDITEEFLEYVRPLIIGETNPTYTNGIPDYLFLPQLSI